MAFARWLLRMLGWAWRGPLLFLRFLKSVWLWAWCVLGVMIVVYLVGVGIFHSPRNLPYRYSEWSSEACQEQRNQADVLSIASSRAGFFGSGDKVTNDEWAALENNPVLQEKNAFSCMTQIHQVRPPSGAASSKPVRYYLSFLEFNEDGEP